MLGAGLCPAGTSPAGVGAPDEAPVANTTPLPDLATGQGQTGRLVDPLTKDYQFTADGRVVGQDTVPQLVMLRLSTLRSSSALAWLGQSFTAIQEKGPSYQRQVASEAATALADLVRGGLVAIVSCTVQEYPGKPDAAAAFVKWRDLTTNVEHDTPIGR